ncbi:MAG: DUF115 domain-containing protein [Alphaproteobacteria bacterium]|nr:DUF115 domain-containing protein [Alphaproteobacteria bacterium]
MKKEQEKYCFTTVVSDNFVHGFIVMLCSLREKNPWMNAPFYVFHHERECPLSEASMTEMRKYYDNIIFHRVDIEKFERILHARDNVIKTPERLASAFFIMEAFTFSDYDRVICIDSDMLVLGDISELVRVKADLAVVHEYDSRTYQQKKHFNSGIVVIGKKYLHADSLKDISDSLDRFDLKAKHGKADQAVLNCYFADKELTFLPHAFNCLKRLYGDSYAKPYNDLHTGSRKIAAKLQKDGIRILHYVGEKPWNLKRKPVEMRYYCAEELWHDAFRKYASPEAQHRYLTDFRRHADEQVAQLTKRIEKYRAFWPYRLQKTLENLSDSKSIGELGEKLVKLAVHVAKRLRVKVIHAWMRYRQLDEKSLEKRQREQRMDVQRRAFLDSGEYDRLRARFENKYEGQRCFIIGNGPSLNQQDLSVLRDEQVFCTNWFMNHPQYHDINPQFYALCSHQIFGGWSHEHIQLEKGMETALATHTRDSVKFFSHVFKSHLESQTALADHELYYLMFDKPKNFIHKIDDMNLDLSRNMDDGHTGVITFCIPLAIFMGFKEIYLLGCDCDYGIDDGKTDVQYFYEKEKHTTQLTDMDSLRRTWSYPDGAAFKAYAVAKRKADEAGVRIVNLTAGGRLEVFPRESLEDVVKQPEAA